MDTIFNRNGCFYRALDDEPVFTLLARDPCFAEVVRYWVTLRQALIGQGKKPLEDHAMLAEAVETATSGVVWRNDSTDPTKGYDAGEHARWHVETPPERELVDWGKIDRLEKRLLQNANLFLTYAQINFNKGTESSIASAEADWTAYLDICGELGIEPADKPTRRTRGDYKQGGHMLPYEDWLTVEQTAMRLGNRFLLWELDGKLVFNENNNYRDPDGKPDWSGYYPIQRSLQKDMLWQALRDFKEAHQRKVDAVRRLIEAPTYANILRRANELGTEGCPSELLTKYLLTFEDDVPVTFYAGDIRKALEALRRERDLAGRPKTIKYFENAEDEEGREVTPMSLNRIAEMLDYATVYGEWDENTPNGATTGLAGEPMNDSRRTAIWVYKKVLGIIPEDAELAAVAPTVTVTSGAGEIDPAKEALWIDMAEERGFLSAEDAEKARAALPAGTKAAVPGKHLTFIVRDLARKIATGLRQVASDMDEWLETKSPKFHTTGSGEKLGGFMDRVNGYAAELEAGEAEAARFRSRLIRMHPALGALYEPQEESLGDPYKRFASLIDYQEMTVEDARKIVEDFRKRFPDVLRVYEGLPTMAELVAKGVVDDLAGQLGRSYEDVAADYRRAAGITEDAPLTAHIKVGKAESDTLDVTDTPEMPPHRFTMFTKARGWAYGRGLEINPAHIPDMLDRMDGDGWHLQAVFGGVEPTKVGMLFKRRPPMVEVTLEDYWRPAWLDSVEEMMAAPTEGVDDLGRGMEP